MNYDYIGDDNSVIEQCLIVQEPFWNFESSINGQETKPCIYKEYIDDIQKRLLFFILLIQLGCLLLMKMLVVFSIL